MPAPNVMERQAPPVNALYWSKRTFGYGGTQLDRGQVVKLQGLPNDRLLVDLGYIALLPEGSSTFPCRVCGSEFMDLRLRDSHGKTVHEEKTYVPLSPPTRSSSESQSAYQDRLDAWAQHAGAASERKDELRDKHESEVAPLDLTKTSASKT